MPYDAATFVGLSGWTRPVGDPACWSWSLRDGFDVSRSWDALRGWQDGRCALCGSTDRRLENDHDHADGIRRGLLCVSCNVHEGSCGEPDCACVGYRQRPPAVIIGVAVPHPGWDAIQLPETPDATSARTGKIRGRRSTL